MDQIKRMQYISELEIEKDKLERRLRTINEHIEKERSVCPCVFIALAYNQKPYFSSYRCVLCGKEVSWTNHRRIVHAENYLPQYYALDDEQRAIKFDLIQILARGLLKDKPDMSSDELAVQLNNLIQENMSFGEIQNESGFVKSKGSKE